MFKVDVPNVPPIEMDFGTRANHYYETSGAAPTWEPLETQLFIRLLSENPRVLDIGANIGWFTTVGSSIAGEKGLFFAFEPEPDNFEALMNNISHNRLYGVHPIRGALSDHDEAGQLFFCEENHGDHRINSVDGRRAINIQIAKLDTVLKPTGFTPDLIKIDIQGAEPAALRGAKRTLERAGKTCAKLMEFWPGGLPGGVDEAKSLADTIFSWDQTVYVCHHEGTGSIRPTDIKTIHQAIDGCIHPSKPSHLELLIAPNDKRMERLQEYLGPAWRPWD